MVVKMIRKDIVMIVFLLGSQRSAALQMPPLPADVSPQTQLRPSHEAARQRPKTHLPGVRRHLLEVSQDNVPPTPSTHKHTILSTDINAKHPRKLF